MWHPEPPFTNFLVFVDYLTKWPEVFATSDQTSLWNRFFFAQCGVPKELLSDRGPAKVMCETLESTPVHALVDLSTAHWFAKTVIGTYLPM